MPNETGPKSIFNPHGDGPALSGLDMFSPPPGQSFSSMPEDLTDGKVETDEGEPLDEEPTLSKDEPVEQIAKVLDDVHEREQKRSSEER